MDKTSSGHKTWKPRNDKNETNNKREDDKKKNHLYCNSMIVGKEKKDEINDIKVLDVFNKF